MFVSYNDRVKHCLTCHTVIGGSMNSDTKYCSDSCRAKDWRRKKKLEKLVDKEKSFNVMTDKKAASELLRLIKNYNKK